nr:Chain P, mupain-1-16 [synthetic construct]
CPAYSAYLAC